MRIHQPTSVFAVVAVVLFSFASPRATMAWNDTGHMTVSRLAWQYLSEDERRQVGELLKTHPHYEIYLSKNRPDGVDEAEWAFVRGGPWADFIRPARPGSEGEVLKGPQITRFHRSPWHYIDVPWVPPWQRNSIDPTTLPARIAATAPSTNPAEPRNILEAYDFNAKILADRAAPAADRAVALTWLEHLIGDIHQPLHACGVYSADFPEGDRGGNEQAVLANGAVVRLHAYWDGALGTSDAHIAINFLARLVNEDPSLAKDRLSELGGDESFQSWIDESHELAVGIAHLNGRLKSARYEAFDAKQILESDVPALPASYDANARDVAKRRVALAGHRLAAAIKGLLSGVPE